MPSPGRASAYADAGQAAGGAAAGALSQDVVLAQVGVVVEGGGLVDIGSRNLQRVGEAVEGLL